MTQSVILAGRITPMRNTGCCCPPLIAVVVPCYPDEQTTMCSSCAAGDIVAWHAVKVVPSTKKRLVSTLFASTFILDPQIEEAFRLKNRLHGRLVV